ncbi:transmembrane protein, putative [Medicago truncatula]|uniref:Transmembrane protein, putative n=2 Tax=Medicago truncatula TaxID=3880 RepID=G7J424_MEDTR|nr:transmembrane protein, putative [Medicago truncatula]
MTLIPLLTNRWWFSLQIQQQPRCSSDIDIVPLHLRPLRQTGEKGEKTWIKCGPRMSGRRIVVLCGIEIFGHCFFPFMLAVVAT